MKPERAPGLIKKQSPSSEGLQQYEVNTTPNSFLFGAKVPIGNSFGGIICDLVQ